MEAKAHLRYARISPRKVQIVLDLIRGKDLALAAAILRETPKAASELLLKRLMSAAANAVTYYSMNERDLDVAGCGATPGPILKRIRPRAQGRAFRLLKRTSHITLVLKEKE